MKEYLIQSNPSVMNGKPVVAGTRITVELILEKLAAGETAEQIIDAHPRLTKQSIEAALDFAAQSALYRRPACLAVLTITIHRWCVLQVSRNSPRHRL